MRSPAASRSVGHDRSIARRPLPYLDGMIPILSRAQMRAFDANAIGPCRVPSLVLMENAGRGAADVLERELLSRRVRGSRVVVVCGTGNNGGDGLVIARHLLVRGLRPVVVLAGDEGRASPDARTNLDAWRSLGGEVRTRTSEASSPELSDEVAEADVVVDALFGTGLERPIEGWLADLVRSMNASAA